LLSLGDTGADPDVALAVEKSAPVHEVALVDDHESVDELPEVIELGFAVRDPVSADADIASTTIGYVRRQHL
jgi:hypothetical protein